MLHIREYRETDWPAVWPILQEAISGGDSLTYSPESTEAEMRHAWIDVPAATFVACEDDGRVVGTYYIKPNQPGLGAHVGNCGYVVATERQGKGIAFQMCEHSQAQAIAMGFRAMQFNIVVAANERAVHVWQKCGFSVVGRLPGAFHHRALGYVDALVMYKTLVDA